MHPFGRPALRFGPLADAPSQAVSVRPEESAFLPAVVGPEEGAALARDRIQSGIVRPVDSHRADMEPAVLVWVPLWRVVVREEPAAPVVRDGETAFGRYAATAATQSPASRAPARTRVVVRPARLGLVFDPSEHAEIPAEALHPLTEWAPDGAEQIAPDVAQDAAMADAGRQVRGGGVLGKVAGVAGLSAPGAVRVESARFVWYPLWLRRYRYEGEASGGKVEACHVAVSAWDRRVVSERHPAAWRALAGRFSRLLRGRGGAGSP